MMILWCRVVFHDAEQSVFCGARMYQFTFIRGTNKFSFVYHFFEYRNADAPVYRQECLLMGVNGRGRKALAEDRASCFVSCPGNRSGIHSGNMNVPVVYGCDARVIAFF